jgi:hypothetical protein
MRGSLLNVFKSDGLQEIVPIFDGRDRNFWNSTNREGRDSQKVRFGCLTTFCTLLLVLAAKCKITANGVDVL